jgi:hypothetical protein
MGNNRCGAADPSINPGRVSGARKGESKMNATERDAVNVVVENWIDGQMITPLSALMQFGNQADRDVVEFTMIQAFTFSKPSEFQPPPALLQLVIRAMRARIRACVIRHAQTMVDEIWAEEQKLLELPAYRALVEAAERARAINETETLE